MTPLTGHPHGRGAACGNCRHFDNAPAALEAALPGLRALGSAYSAVRSQDGICGIHRRYLAADAVCDQHAARGSCFAKER